MSMGDYRAVFFDIGNVLLKFDVRRVARKMAWALGRHPMAIARYLWNSDLIERIELGRLSPDDLYGMFRRELAFSGSYREFVDVWSDHFTLERGTAALMRKIARSRRVYLLSNTNEIHFEFIRRRYAFPRYAHGAVLSYRLGLRKPDPAIYRAALRRARVQARQAVFIDDLPENLKSAGRMGITTLRYVGVSALKRDLLALGLI